LGTNSTARGAVRDGAGPPRQSGRSGPAAGTIGSYVGPFLNTLRYVRERSEHTVMAYGQDLASFLRFCDLGGLVTPEQVRAKHVELYVAWLRQERGACPSPYLKALRRQGGRLPHRHRFLGILR
jgi:hypothetical protein